MEKAKIIIVDDDMAILQLLKDFLEMEGFDVDVFSDGKSAIENFTPKLYSLAILDLKLPDMPGTQVLENFKNNDKDVEIVMLTGFSTTDSAIQALRLGAFDYMTKPFSLDGIKLLVKNAINSYFYKTENRRLLHDLQIANSKLAKRVEAADKELAIKHAELQKITLATMESFVFALETKDSYTAGHSQRVTHYSINLAKKLKLTDRELALIDNGAKLHDIGKIFIKDSYLNKPGALTDEEYQELKRHPELGAKLIEPFDFLKEAIPIIKYHHERVDGRGYPAGLKKSDLNIYSRIVMIADSFDAMSSDRAYRKALPPEKIYRELVNGAGTQFDSEIVEVFIRMMIEEGFFPPNIG